MTRRVIVRNYKGLYLAADGGWVKPRTQARVMEEMEALRVLWSDFRERGEARTVMIYVS